MYIDILYVFYSAPCILYIVHWFSFPAHYYYHARPTVDFL